MKGQDELETLIQHRIDHLQNRIDATNKSLTRLADEQQVNLNSLKYWKDKLKLVKGTE